MRVVMVRPGEEAEIKELGESLENYQAAVEGFIEAYYPFPEEVCIVCNEEGKINGMEPCRAIYDDSGEIVDIVFGPFFLCSCAGEDFESLTPEQAQSYRERFLLPEHFYLTGTSFTALPYEP